MKIACLLTAILLLPWQQVVLGQEEAPGPADLAATSESPRTPEIQDLAKELGNDPVRIIQWVQSSILVEPTFGIFKGGEAALDDRSANPADQAALTIALLRSAGVPARHVVGRVRMTREVATKWLGYPGALDILQRAQTPLFRQGDTVFPNPQFANASLRHVWVEFFVQGHGWIAADPSFKETVIPSKQQYQLSEDAGDRLRALVESVTVDPATSGVTGMDEESVVRTLNDLRQAFERRHSSDLPRLLRRPDLIAPQYRNLDDLKGAFPHQPQAVELRAAGLPEDLHLRVRISWAGLNVSLTGAVATDRRISLYWLPSRATDVTAIQRQGLFAALSDGVRLAPVVAVDGEIRAVGQTPQPSGTTSVLQIRFEYPAGGTAIEPGVGPSPGGFVSVLLGWGHGAPGSFRRLGNLLRQTSPNSPIPMEMLLGSLFHLQGSVFWFVENFAMRLAERTTEAILLRRPSVLISGYYILPGTREASIGSLFVSGLAGTTIVVSGADRASAASLRWLQGLLGTAAEGRVFQMLYRAPGSSTVEIIRSANRLKIPLLYARPDNVESVVRSVDIPQRMRELAISRARSPLAVHLVMPSRSVRVGNSNVWGFYEFDPQTGGSGGWIDVYAKGGVLLPYDLSSKIFGPLSNILKGSTYLLRGSTPSWLGGAGIVGGLVSGIYKTANLYYDLLMVTNSGAPLPNQIVAAATLTLVTSMSLLLIGAGVWTTATGIMAVSPVAGLVIIGSILDSILLEKAYNEVLEGFSDLFR